MTAKITQCDKIQKLNLPSSFIFKTSNVSKFLVFVVLCHVTAYCNAIQLQQYSVSANNKQSNSKIVTIFIAEF